MKRSLIIFATTMALLTNAVRIGEDKDETKPKVKKPTSKKAPNSESTGNVYDDYKPFVMKDEFDEMPYIH